MKEINGIKVYGIRPWWTEEEQEKIVEHAIKMAKGNEISKITFFENVYREQCVRVTYMTATERQKKYGLWDDHNVCKPVYKFPKKNQPKCI